MAGRANQGDLWVLPLRLDLLLPIVCAGFRTRSLASVQNLGSRERPTFNEIGFRVLVSGPAGCIEEILEHNLKPLC